MKRDYDLIITNNLTNECIVVHDLSRFVYTDNNLCGSILDFYIHDYLVNQVPFRVEFVYK